MIITICIGACLIFSILAISCDKQGKSATDIYNESIYNVVEVKATTESVGESFGTGEVISTDGHIITNAHVITYTKSGEKTAFDNYYIRFAFEDNYRAVTLEKYDSDLDVAVLKLADLTNLNLKPITIGDSSKIKAGEKVYAIGNATNYGIGIFEGIISIPLLNVELDGTSRSVIQCDLTIAAGNSGGALLDSDGKVIGITTFRTKDSSNNVIYGIVYCLPINTVMQYVNM